MQIHDETTAACTPAAATVMANDPNLGNDAWRAADEVYKYLPADTGVGFDAPKPGTPLIDGRRRAKLVMTVTVPFWWLQRTPAAAQRVLRHAVVEYQGRRGHDGPHWTDDILCQFVTTEDV